MGKEKGSGRPNNELVRSPKERRFPQFVIAESKRAARGGRGGRGKEAVRRPRDRRGASPERKKKPLDRSAGSPSRAIGKKKNLISSKKERFPILERNRGLAPQPSCNGPATATREKKKNSSS